MKFFCGKKHCWSRNLEAFSMFTNPTARDDYNPTVQGLETLKINELAQSKYETVESLREYFFSKQFIHFIKTNHYIPLTNVSIYSSTIICLK